MVTDNRGQWPIDLSGLGWGGDYNPEQWPEEVWAEDVELMRRAGVNVVTVGVFSWALLEVSEGRYEFGWLDRVLDTLHAGGIRVDLATATASPPPWMSQHYPEILPVRADGSTLWHGSRQAYCPSSPVYRERALALAGKLADRYGDHPSLAAWHVGNEYGCHVARCYCDRSASAFRQWLLARHGSLDALNDAWGTTFWGQRYSDWAQILPPRDTPAFSNPGHVMDFDRFSSDALLELFVAERDLLRGVTPEVPVTTNFMVMYGTSRTDYWSWAAEVDFVSNDNYLRGESAERHIELGFAADLTRGLAGGKPWLLMEHSTSAVNWQQRNLAKLPGELRRNSFGHTARGADGTLFFQWRQSVAGAERYHSAMLPHAGPDTKIFREVCQVGAEYERIRELTGSTITADVAIVYDWPSAWVSEQSALHTGDFSYQDTVFSVYRELWSAGVTPDFVPAGADLTRYRLVLVPALNAVSDADAQGLIDYVAGGGQVLVTYLSGLTDERGHVRLGGYAGAFREMLGIRVEEFFPLGADARVSLDNGGQATVWTELLQLAGAEAVAHYVDGALPGVPAITRNRHGSGTAYYLACGLVGEAMTTLIRAVLASAGVAGIDSPPGVELVRRTGVLDGEPASWLIAINHTDHDVAVPADGLELLTETESTGQLTIPAGGVAVVRESP